MRRVLAMLLVVAIIAGPLPAWATNCSPFRVWSTGDQLTASDLSTSMTTIATTNMNFSCLGDYSATQTQMETSTDPNSSGSPSLATSGAGELERIRFTFEHLTGWSSWWSNYENLNFGNRSVRVHLTTTTTFQPIFRGEVHLSSASTRFHVFSISASAYTAGGAHPESDLILAHVAESFRFKVGIGGDVHVGSTLAIHAQGSATHPSLYWHGSSASRRDGIYFPAAGHVGMTTSGVGVAQFHTNGLFSTADGSADIGTGGGSRFRHLHITGNLTANGVQVTNATHGTSNIFTWHLGGLMAAADNTYDVGTSAGSRFRHLHLSGALALSDGSASNPSWTFGADSDTGMYRPGDNALSWTLGGTQKVSINTSQMIMDNDHEFGWGSLGANFTVRLGRPATNQLRVLINSSEEALRIHAGGLMAGVNNSYDIGTVSGSQFRHLHLAGTLVADRIESKSGGARGTWGSRGQFSRVGDHASTYVFNLTAHAVTLMGASNHATTVIAAPSAVSADIRTTGPVAGGRDRATEFSAGSWVHFYWIGDGTTGTIAAIASANPPTTGPNLPHSYTSWSYSGAVYHSAVGMPGTHIMGAWAYYHSAQVVHADAATTSATVIDLATAVPPNALETSFVVQGDVVANAGSSSTSTFNISPVSSGSSFAGIVTVTAPAAGQRVLTAAPFVVPAVSQRIHYSISNLSSPQSAFWDVYVTGYRLPNGG